jgi:hypothetical protein
VKVRLYTDFPLIHHASLGSYLIFLDDFFDLNPSLFEEALLAVLVPFEALGESEEP